MRSNLRQILMLHMSQFLKICFCPVKHLKKTPCPTANIMCSRLPSTHFLKAATRASMACLGSGVLNVIERAELGAAGVECHHVSSRIVEISFASCIRVNHS